MKKVILGSIIILSLALACNKDEDDDSNVNSNPTGTTLSLPDILFNYANLNLPAYYTNGPVANTDNTPNNNPVTNEGATLGRVLFYDKNLSLNNTIACASCHKQDFGFSDPAVFSDGFEGGQTGRHSMTLINARYYNPGHFFWDERAETLEDQVLMPIQDGVEMGMTLDSLVNRLATLDYYPDLFIDAFGDNAITSGRISSALSQFVRSIVSFDSKYDQGRTQVNNPNDDFPNFTAQENLGKQLFLSPATGCAACHGTDAFIAPEARNNGLDATTTDVGIASVSGNANDEGKFKVGSLRGIADNAPYMHDGRFSTLAEVVEHYNSGVQNHPNLDQRLKTPNGNVRRLNLTQNEKDALVAFLETLSDDVLGSDEKYSDPF